MTTVPKGPGKIARKARGATARPRRASNTLPSLAIHWTGAARAMLDLGHGAPCRFPIGEPNSPSFRFCCAPATEPYRSDIDRPTYCAEHATSAYAPRGFKHRGWRAEGARVLA